MRFIILYAVFFGALTLRSQSFHKRALVIDLNSGFEFYHTTLNYQKSFSDQNRDTSTKATAGNVNFSLGAELGLGKHIGMGLRGKANNFIEDLDAVSKNTVDIKSTDLVLFINIHPVVRKKLDIIIGGEAGLSGLNFSIDNFEKTTLKGTGTFMSVYLNPRLYLGRFGVNLKAYMPFAWYPSFTSAPGDPGQFLLEKWKGNGFGVSVGLQVRLF
jgi:hypothetical protein